jgi:cytidylate kinase
METGMHKCLSFIQCHLQPARRVTLPSGEERWRAVTISRQTGSGGHAVAELLAEYLQKHIPKHCPWTVFDRNLVEKVLEDHHLPARIAQFMPEDRVSRIEDILDDLLGVHPPAETLVHKTTQTILHLAELGNVIIIGRGANVITSRLDYVFHVRLIGSLEKRAGRIQEVQHAGKAAALKFIRREDRGRQRYLKKYFGKKVDDPMLYHLTINTDLVSYQTAAEMIGSAVISKPRDDSPRLHYRDDRGVYPGADPNPRLAAERALGGSPAGG